MNLVSHFKTTNELAIVTKNQSASYGGLSTLIKNKISEYRDLPKGSVFWLVVFNDVDTLVTMFALWDLGFCVFAVDPQIKQNELALINKKLVCNFKIDKSESLLLDTIKCVDTIEPELAQTALLQLTSGSTGEPKLLKISLDALIYRSSVNANHLLLNSEDKTLCTMPLSHSHGLDCLTLPTLFKGGQVYLFEPATAFPFRILEWIRKYRITFFSSLPQMYDLFNQTVIKNSLDYQSLRYAFCGSAALSQMTAEKFKQKFGLRLYQGYGLAEIGVISVNLDSRSATAASIGEAIPGIQWKVASDGELLVRSKALFQGYYKDPQQTKDRFHNGFLKTQDLVTVDNNNFLYVTGRKNDFINVMGKKVFPREIEDQLSDFPLIKEYCVVGVPDPIRGEVPALFLSPAELKSDKIKIENCIIAELSKKLEEFKVPRKFIWIDKFPKSPIGKILRSQLSLLIT
jgi:long-chain acyl-CoA synthetase